MLAGNLRDKIDIYGPTETVNDYNEREKAYELLFSTRAEISFLSGNEKAIETTTAASQILKFKVRYKHEAYGPEMYIKHAGAFYNIRSINIDRHRHFIILEAEREPGFPEIV